MKKYFILFVGLNFMGMLGCCGCEVEKLLFFDFPKLTVNIAQKPAASSVVTPTGVNTFLSKTLILSLKPDSIIFVAQATPSRFQTNTLMACSPPRKGSRGPKFPVIDFNIYSDQPFNDTLPAGASLRSIFKSIDFRQDVWDVKQLEIKPFDSLLLQCIVIPTDLNLDRRFFIEMIKSDNSKLLAKTTPIRWGM
jgi:hypothetical protein